VFVLLFLCAAFSESFHAAEVGGLDFKCSADTYLLGKYANIEDSVINVDNRSFKIPKWAGRVDLRPSAKVSYKDFRVVAEPRFQLEPEYIEHPITQNEVEFRYPFSLTQLYGEWAANDFLILSTGIENFQWGPAELFTPSNPLIHFDPRQKSMFWVERGRGVARANLTFGDHWSAVTLLQYYKNDAARFNAGKDSRIIGLLKIEYQQSGSFYIGMSAGKGNETRPSIGQYISVSPGEGISIYADARQTMGSDAWYPTTVNFERSRQNSSSLEGLVNFGVRLEGRADVRAEFLYNSEGLTEKAFSQTLSSALLSGSVTSDQTDRALHGGRELPGRFYLYQSVRMADLWPQNKVTLMARYLHSMMDQSGVGFADAEIVLNDWATLVAEIMLARGKANSEFTLGEKFSIEAGVKVSF
jgi:hypothetical protein